MVHGVIVDAPADREHRIGEARRARPLECHALVAGHVHDQTPGSECGEVRRLEVQQRPVGILQCAVDDDVALGEERGEWHTALVGDDLAEVRAVVIELDHLRGVDRRRDRRRPPVREHTNVMHAVRPQRRHGTARGGAEPDHHAGQASSVVARRPAQLQGVQHRAVAGDLIVHVEDVEAEGSVAAPVVHRLERDHGEAFVEGELGHHFVLDEVRPSPENLAVAHVAQVGVLRLRQEQDVGGGDQLGAVEDAAHERPQIGVLDPEPLAVAGLEQHVRAQIFGNPVEVARMQWHAALIRLARGADDAQDQGCAGSHDRLLPSSGVEPTP